MSGTKYQILYKDSPKIENFGTKAAFLKRQKELRAAGIRFTTWDTRGNALARMF